MSRKLIIAGNLLAGHKVPSRVFGCHMDPDIAVALAGLAALPAALAAVAAAAAADAVAVAVAAGIADH